MPTEFLTGVKDMDATFLQSLKVICIEGDYKTLTGPFARQCAYNTSKAVGEGLLYTTYKNTDDVASWMSHHFNSSIDLKFGGGSMSDSTERFREASQRYRALSGDLQMTDIMKGYGDIQRSKKLNLAADLMKEAGTGHSFFVIDTIEDLIGKDTPLEETTTWLDAFVAYSRLDTVSKDDYPVVIFTLDRDNVSKDVASKLKNRCDGVIELNFLEGTYGGAGSIRNSIRARVFARDNPFSVSSEITDIVYPYYDISWKREGGFHLSFRESVA